MGDRLIAEPRRMPETLHEPTARDDQLVVLESTFAGRRLGYRPLVVVGLPEAHGKAVDARPRLGRQRHPDASGVEATAQQHAYGHVADAAQPNRIVKRLLEPVGRLIWGDISRHPAALR